MEDELVVVKIIREHSASLISDGDSISVTIPDDKLAAAIHALNDAAFDIGIPGF